MFHLKIGRLIIEAVLFAFYEKIFNHENTKTGKHEIDLIYFS